MRIASYETHRKKFHSKTRFSRISQTNCVVRLASLANRNFVARLARIITNFISGVLRESCENFGLTLISHYELWFCLFASLENCKTRKLRDLQAWQYIAFFSSRKTREIRETRTDIFARSKSHFPQNSREKNCETRLAVSPMYRSIHRNGNVYIINVSSFFLKHFNFNLH